MKTTFASLVTLPIIITEPGEYITRRGETVTIDTVTSKQSFGCTGNYSNGGVIDERWHKSGRLYLHAKSDNDIIKRK